MLNKKNFSSMRKELETFDSKREEIIKESRVILKSSKQLIYTVHRNDMKKAEQLMKEIKHSRVLIKKMVNSNAKLNDVGILNSAVQEYVEGAAYYGFVKEKKIPTSTELNVDTENYLLGLCDLTGELARKAVISATSNDVKMVERIRKLVDGIFEQFTCFDFRNGELRKKADAIKWNLKKIEEIQYDLKKR